MAALAIRPVQRSARIDAVMVLVFVATMLMGFLSSWHVDHPDVSSSDTIQAVAMFHHEHRSPTQNHVEHSTMHPIGVPPQTTELNAPGRSGPSWYAGRTIVPASLSIPIDPRPPRA